MNTNNVLTCPDCFVKLSLKAEDLTCPKCMRAFLILSSKCVELIPSKFLAFGNDDVEPSFKSSIDFYQKCHQLKLELKDTPTYGWGDLRRAQQGYIDFVTQERQLIKDMLNKIRFKGVLLDLGSGVGNYSLYLSKMANLIIDVEIDNNNINAAWHSANQQKIDNIIFVKADYIQLPVLDNSIDAVISTDFLIRGPTHDRIILKNIYRIMKTGGHTIVDFHNRHRLFSFKSNRRIKEYTYSETVDLIRSAGINHFNIKPFGYVPPNKLGRFYLPLDRLFSHIPFAGKQCTRWLVHFTKP